MHHAGPHRSATPLSVTFCRKRHSRRRMSSDATKSAAAPPAAHVHSTITILAVRDSPLRQPTPAAALPSVGLVTGAQGGSERA